MHIKTIKIFLLIGILCLSFFSAYADDEPKPVKPTIITIVKSGDILERGICNLPQAYYSDGYIYVTFESDVYGMASVNVTNISTGAILQEWITASFETSIVDINSIVSSGDYVVEFNCDNSDSFIGYFTL